MLRDQCGAGIIQHFRYTYQLERTQVLIDTIDRPKAFYIYVVNQDPRGLSPGSVKEFLIVVISGFS